MAQTGVVQQGSQVEVVEVDDDGGAGRSLGSAALVTPDVAVMAVGNREPAPSLPLRVLVPAAAGGGRDEHDTRAGHGGALEIDVLRVHAAADGSDHVALELASPAPATLTEEALLRSTGPRTVGLADLQADENRWWCKIVPWACR